MKKAVTCVHCHKPIRESFAYKVEWERQYQNPVTGKTETETIKGYVCPICNEIMGYKSSAKKLEKMKNVSK